MAETIANWFVTTFEGTLAREWIVFLVSMLPILELRGGIIAGFAMNMEWLPTFIIAYIGNIVPIPFILLFIRYIFKVLKKTPMRKVVEWCERRADQKRKPPGRCECGPDQTGPDPHADGSGQGGKDGSGSRLPGGSCLLSGRDGRCVCRGYRGSAGDRTNMGRGALPF